MGRSSSAPCSMHSMTRAGPEKQPPTVRAAARLSTSSMSTNTCDGHKENQQAMSRWAKAPPACLGTGRAGLAPSTTQSFNACMLITYQHIRVLTKLSDACKQLGHLGLGLVGWRAGPQVCTTACWAVVPRVKSKSRPPASLRAMPPIQCPMGSPDHLPLPPPPPDSPARPPVTGGRNDPSHHHHSYSPACRTQRTTWRTGCEPGPPQARLSGTW